MLSSRVRQEPGGAAADRARGDARSAEALALGVGLPAEHAYATPPLDGGVSEEVNSMPPPLQPRVDLKDKGGLASSYERAAVVAKHYATSDLPPEATFLSELRGLLVAYRAVLREPRLSLIHI